MILTASWVKVYSVLRIYFLPEPSSVREDTSSGRKCDVTFLLFLRKYAKIGKNNREKLVPYAKSSLPVSTRNIREL